MGRTAWIGRLGHAVVAAVVVAVLAAGCSRQGEPAREPGPMRVVVSIPPLAGLVRPLVHEGAEVRVLVQAGQSPHGYEPRPSDIAAIARADLVVLVGMGVESSLPGSGREGERVLVMAEALGLGTGTAGEHAEHGHAHGAGDADPHLWLDPMLVGEFVPVLAERVRGAVQSAATEASAAASVDARESALLMRIRAVDDDYQSRLRPFADASIITQHTAWSRLAARYGLEVAAVIQVVEDAEPTPGHIAEVVAAAREHRVRAVLSEVQLDARIAERIAAQVGVPIGRLDPLGRGDWEAMMRTNLDELIRVLGHPSEAYTTETEPTG